MPTPQVVVIKDRQFENHLQDVFHLENPKRVAAFESVMDDAALDGKWREITPRPATVDELAWIHTPEYIARIAASSGKPLTSFDMETQATARSYETAQLAVGGIFSLLDEISADRARRGFAFVRPPGHHAERNRAMGFCLFNNIALAAAYLNIRHGASRIMVVDIDAHHGNGIQSAFYDTDSVLYCSWHQFPGFPGTGNVGEVGSGKGEGFTVNIPLGKGEGDKTFSQIILQIVRPIAAQYRPEWILVACGFDLYLHDRLGGMRVTPQGYAMLTRLLADVAETVCGGRIVFVAEGGYSIKGIRACGTRVMLELCGVQTLDAKTIQKMKPVRLGRFSSLRKVVDVQRKYWNGLCGTTE
jgi:acetoin utilization deacetylase AcuC-like enzyme